MFPIRIHLIRIQHVRLNTDPDPGFDDQKFMKIYRWKKLNFFIYQKLQFTYRYLSLGLHKGRLSYRRSLQPSKEENIQHFKTWNFLIFSIFVGHFAPLDSDACPLSTDLIESGSRLRKHWLCDVGERDRPELREQATAAVLPHLPPEAGGRPALPPARTCSSGQLAYRHWSLFYVPLRTWPL